MTFTPLSVMRARISFSMSSAPSPGTATGISWAPRPVMTSTADTNPCAKSPWPATIARGFALSPGARSFIVLLQIATYFRRGAHGLHETLIEALGRIDPAGLEQMIHCDDFRDHRDVLSRVQRNGDLW